MADKFLETMDAVLQEATGNPQGIEINDTQVQLMRQCVKKLTMLANTTLEEIQDYEGGQMKPQDFLDNMHSDWISLVQQMDKVRQYLDKLGVDLTNTELYIRHWR